MIKPHKYLDLGYSVINVSSLIILYLLDMKIAKYDDVYKTIENRLGREAKNNFLPALNLLFLFGKIRYDAEIDSLELIK